MTIPEAADSISPSVSDAVATRVDCESPAIQLRGNEAQRHDDVWQKLIDRFVEWGQAPKRFDEDEWESPSAAAVGSAYRLIVALRDGSYPPPLRVVPNGEGGIVLERTHESMAEVFEIEANGTVEYMIFANCRLVTRRRVEIE